MKVGIQGTEGSFHEEVALGCFGENTEIEYIDTFKHVFDELQAGTVGRAVVAIANNRYGIVPDAFNQLISRHEDVEVVGESYLRVKHQLLGVPGTELEKIREIHSQAPALGQCGLFLSEVLPEAVLVEQKDTAESARLVAELNNPEVAAIASRRAGAISRLEVIAPDIQDDKDNFTRFLVLAKKRYPRMLFGNKTTALLRTGQSAGSLYQALGPFAEHGVNISTINSSVLPNTGFHMQFLLDADAGADSTEMTNIIRQLDKQGARLEVLGSYMSGVHEMDRE